VLTQILQFLLRSSDEDVERYLKLFTFVSLSDIAAVMAEHNGDPGKRKAQHLLASEVLELVHGRDEAERTRAEHQALRNPTVASLARKAGSIQTSDQEGASATSQQRAILPASLVLDTPFSRILFHAGIVPTKSEGARLVAKGGAYVASVVSGPQGEGDDKLDFVHIKDQTPEEVRNFVRDGLLILRTGKWKVRVIEMIEDADFAARGLDAPGWAEWKNSRQRSGESL